MVPDKKEGMTFTEALVRDFLDNARQQMNTISEKVYGLEMNARISAIDENAINSLIGKMNRIEKVQGKLADRLNKIELQLAQRK